MFIWKKEPNNNMAIYRQLADYIISLINTGGLKAGTRLPSERILAETFSISRNTVIAAMDYLKDNGYIRRQEKTGSVVANQHNPDPNAFDWQALGKRSRINAAEDGFLYAKGYHEQLHLTRRHVYGSLNFAEYIAVNMQTEELNVAGISGEEATDRQGIYSLRESICTHMETFGIYARPEQVAVFTSITQILNTLSNIFLNLGHKLLS
jgi:DNA-binding transcriptional MocR family regulator